MADDQQTTEPTPGDLRFAVAILVERSADYQRLSDARRKRGFEIPAREYARNADRLALVARHLAAEASGA